VNKLRTDKISYVEQKPPSTGKKRLNPDFNLPFGNPDFKVNRSFYYYFVIIKRVYEGCWDRHKILRA
jgi:hypothetical protein